MVPSKTLTAAPLTRGHQLLTALCDFHFDMAGPAHFFPLQDVERVSGRKPAMLYKIRAKCTGSRTGGGIFIKLPGKHATREGFAVVSAREAIRHGAVLSKQLAQLGHVHDDFAECGATAKRNHQIEYAG